jgi:hypothetical protein
LFSIGFLALTGQKKTANGLPAPNPDISKPPVVESTNTTNQQTTQLPIKLEDIYSFS